MASYEHGSHSSHLWDPAGTTDANCVDCQALWDARVLNLHVRYAAALAAEGMDAVNIARAMGVWFRVAAEAVKE